MVLPISLLVNAPSGGARGCVRVESPEELRSTLPVLPPNGGALVLPPDGGAPLAFPRWVPNVIERKDGPVDLESIVQSQSVLPPLFCGRHAKSPQNAPENPLEFGP